MASLNDPRDTSGRLIAASQVSGTRVYNPNGEHLGSVQDILVDKVAGRIAFAVLSFGGFLGIGDRHYPLPWDQLNYDQSLGGYVVNLNRDRLEGAPSFSDAEPAHWNDEAWGRRIQDYYGPRPSSSSMPAV